MLETDFGLQAVRWMAIAHLHSGMLKLVSQVPVLMLKQLRQSEHR